MGLLSNIAQPQQVQMPQKPKPQMGLLGAQQQQQQQPQQDPLRKQLAQALAANPTKETMSAIIQHLAKMQHPKTQEVIQMFNAVKDDPAKIQSLVQQIQNAA